ncbi:MAG: PadR family transcriptional regulator [Acidobacteria bacterium]|nr:PadR family transcriptional regulator [Acidobacteriota bacterium]
MPLLTRTEELIMLAVWQLGQLAYSLPIRQRLEEITGDPYSLGSVYMPLDRLVKKGFLDSSLSEATPERGGRHKRIYRLTEAGRAELHRVQQVQQAMWSITLDIPAEPESQR